MTSQMPLLCSGEFNFPLRALEVAVCAFFTKSRLFLRAQLPTAYLSYGLFFQPISYSRGAWTTPTTYNVLHTKLNYQRGKSHLRSIYKRQETPFPLGRVRIMVGHFHASPPKHLELRSMLRSYVQGSSFSLRMDDVLEVVSVNAFGSLT